MILTLINCKDKLTALGIDIDAVGGWDILRNKVIAKLPILSCNYDCMENTLTIEVEDGTPIPDMSEFGEVATNAST